MTRALIDIPADKLKQLDALAAHASTSRAAMVRQAIDRLLEAETRIHHQDAFGLLKDAPIDALGTQRRLRDEW